MKKVLFIYLSFLAIYTLAQNNDLNPNSKWHCKDLDGTSECKYTYNYNLYFNGDSIINGNQYLKLYKVGNVYNSFFSGNCPYYNAPYHGFTALVRYHQNKLFLFNGVSDDLYIDYNLQIGDTIKNVMFSPFFPLKITRTDSVNVNGNFLTRFFFQSTSTADTGYVMEKIGSNHGFISEFTPFFESYKELICYAENNIPVYNDQFIHHASCSIITGIQESDLQPLQFEIYPNPIMNEFAVKSKTNEQIKKLTIKNYFGQIISETYQADLSHRYDISYLKPGLYLILIETESGSTAKKIIKQ